MPYPQAFAPLPCAARSPTNKKENPFEVKTLNDHAGLATTDWESKCFSAKTPQTRSQASLKCKSFAVPLKSREFRLGRDWKRETRVLGISDSSPQRDKPWRIFTKITLLQTGVPSSGRMAVLEQFLSPKRWLLPCPRTLSAWCCCPAHHRAGCSQSCFPLHVRVRVLSLEGTKGQRALFSFQKVTLGTGFTKQHRRTLMSLKCSTPGDSHLQHPSTAFESFSTAEKPTFPFTSAMFWASTLYGKYTQLTHLKNLIASWCTLEVLVWGAGVLTITLPP